MSMNQRNTVITLVIFLLILAFFSLRVFQMIQTDTFVSANLFSLWGMVIAAAIVATIASMILASVGSAVAHAVRTNENPPEEHFMEDERDKLISLKGTQVTYVVYSIGVLAAMINFVLNEAPLMLFTLLVAVGLIAQILGDIYRLFRYRTGS